MKQKSVIRTAAAAAVAGATFLWVTFTGGARMKVPSYTVATVLDGDSFITNENLRVRLASTDAPELKYCGGPEAKRALESFILGKELHLHVIYVDSYRRLVSMVYTKDGLLNEQLIRKGYSSYSHTTQGYNEIFRSAADEARSAKRGIHGLPCTEMVNTKNPSCNIKGNIREGKKTYNLPECLSYTKTLIQLYEGDQWFCSEEEAKAAGFSPAAGCP